MAKKVKEMASRPEPMQDAFLKAFNTAFGDDFEIYKKEVQL